MRLRILVKFFFIASQILFFSCKSTYEAKDIKTVTIQEIKRDSTSIRAIYPIDKNILYYAGSKGDIGFTADGGKTWKVKKITHKDTLKPHFRSIAFDGKSILTLSISNPALLYSYNINTSKIKLEYKEEHKDVFYDCMKWKDNFGIAIGDPINNKLSIITNRNGKWIKIENAPKIEKGEAFFAASNSNIKIIDNTIWIVSGGKKSRIFKSTNKGKTWEIIETPFIQGESTQGMYSIDFFDKNNGVVIGGNYSKPNENSNNKAITSDGGKTWEIVSNAKPPGYKSCVKYVPNSNAKEIFCVGKTGISYSNDGGKKWTEVSKDSYYSIHFVNKNFAWLSGQNKIGKLILK